MRRILLLTGTTEALQFRMFLKRCNPQLKISEAQDLRTLRAHLRGREAETRILAFLTDVIVPNDILSVLALKPYNIHPGPPEFPGSHPDSFAIWEEAAAYGVTGHEMAAAVDSGPIVHVERFPMPPCADRMTLVEQAFHAAVRAFAWIGGHCAVSDQDLPRLEESWGPNKRTRHDFQALCESAADCTPPDLERLQRACGEDLPDPYRSCDVRLAG